MKRVAFLLTLIVFVACARGGAEKPQRAADCQAVIGAAVSAKDASLVGIAAANLGEGPFLGSPRSLEIGDANIGILCSELPESAACMAGKGRLYSVAGIGGGAHFYVHSLVAREGGLVLNTVSESSCGGANPGEAPNFHVWVADDRPLSSHNCHYHPTCDSSLP